MNKQEFLDKLSKHLKDNNIGAVFHYLSLHKSPYYKEKYKGEDLPNADGYTDRLLRLPFYFELTAADLQLIIGAIRKFYPQIL